jgi:lipopolysaccharide export system permease protein
VVMQATGFSAFRLARPVMYFGLIVMLMHMVLAHVLVPASQARLADRSAEISENVTARFLNEGRFMHPSTGITLYIREITQLGELKDIFLADSRNPDEQMVYTAEKALLVRGPKGPSLVMLDGAAQRLLVAPERLSITRFSDFAMDLSGLIKGSDTRRLTLNELSTATLLRADPAMIDKTWGSRAAFLEEAHSRVATPLMALAAPLLGFAALMLGAYSRFGLLPQMVFGVILLIGMQMISTTASGIALASAAAWPLIYLAPVSGLIVAVGLLWYAQRPRRRKAGAIT